MAQDEQTGNGSRVHTRCGRTISVSRFGHEPLPPGMGRVVLDTAWEPYDHGEVWASLTPEEARRIAGLLLFHAAAVEPPAPGPPGRAEAVPICGDAYEVSVRGHVVTVDQPVADGGADTAPSPVELFAAALASCTAHYAGRFLDQHGLSRDGLRVRADYSMAGDRPARVAAIAVRVVAPHVPPARVRALEAVAAHCTVTNTLQTPPEVTLAVHGERQGEAAPARHGGAAAGRRSWEHA